MSVTCMEENRCLTASLSGELDHHRAREVMEELDRQIDAALPRKLTLDLAGLTFTDRSGIAVVRRTFRRMRQLQGSMAVVNAPEQARRVFQAAGLDKLVPFEPDVKSKCLLYARRACAAMKLHPSKEVLHMNAENYVTLEFPSRSANEGFARAAAACFAAQLDPTLEEINDIKTAVSEAVTNAIVHAYPDRIGRVVMKLRRRENQVLEIVVRDWGVGIADVEQARTPLFTTGSEERSGMGFTIMESFMDSLKVRSAPGKGTTVTMRRQIARRVSG